jgi:hypothetical protein
MMCSMDLHEIVAHDAETAGQRPSDVMTVSKLSN